MKGNKNGLGAGNAHKTKKRFNKRIIRQRRIKRKLQKAFSLFNFALSCIAMLYGFIINALIGDVNGWDAGGILFTLGFIWLSVWNVAQDWPVEGDKHGKKRK